MPKKVNVLQFVRLASAVSCDNERELLHGHDHGSDSGAADDAVAAGISPSVLVLVLADRMGDVFLLPSTPGAPGSVTWLEPEFLAGHLSTVTAMVTRSFWCGCSWIFH